MRLGNCLNKTKISFKTCSKYLVWNCKEHWTGEEGATPGGEEATWGRYRPLRKQDPDAEEQGVEGEQIDCLFRQVKPQTEAIQAASSRCWLRTEHTERTRA